MSYSRYTKFPVFHFASLDNVVINIDAYLYQSTTYYF